ncbi:hypothetical protein EJ377_15705 [Chryseobacterium arthrosphaerae]|uniref:Uncharacterized protein n=1 Tax=Chryseobacterium arthrosphaerae TaxID=651561 RepID=A0A432DSX0_9FLAO|nr:hypothetical protein EJ377_15705 [Chryseobacterium arthrosphaerae]
MIERYVKDRYPKRQSVILTKRWQTKAFQQRRAYFTFKITQALLDNPAAKNYIETAYHDHPEDDSVKVEYATVLHIIGSHSEKSFLISCSMRCWTKDTA